MTPDRALVRDSVRRLDADDFTAFVAAVWSARGWTVERDEETLIARDGDRTKRLLPVAADRQGLLSAAAAEAVDVLVTADDAAVSTAVAGDTTVVDDAALVDLFLYGIADDDRSRIAERQFGGPLAELQPPVHRRLARRLGSVTLPNGAARIALVFVAVAVGVVALQMGLAGTELDDESPGIATPTAATGTPPPATAVPSGADEIPGIEADGEVDPGRLLEAHGQQLEGRSYRTVRSYQGPPPNGETSQRLVRSRTLERTPLRTLVEVRSTWANGSQAGTWDLYTDGEHWYRATYQKGSFVYRNVSDSDRLLVVYTAGTNVLEGSLQTTDSLVVEERTETDRGVRYRIAGRGAPTGPRFAGVRNYTVTAIVDRQGIVHRLSANYTLVRDGQQARAAITWRLALDRDLVVDQPRWYRQQFAQATNTP